MQNAPTEQSSLAHHAALWPSETTRAMQLHGAGLVGVQNQQVWRSPHKLQRGDPCAVNLHEGWSLDWCSSWAHESILLCHLSCMVPSPIVCNQKLIHPLVWCVPLSPPLQPTNRVAFFRSVLDRGSYHASMKMFKRDATMTETPRSPCSALSWSLFPTFVTSLCLSRFPSKCPSSSTRPIDTYIHTTYMSSSLLISLCASLLVCLFSVLWDPKVKN